MDIITYNNLTPLERFYADSFEKGYDSVINLHRFALRHNVHIFFLAIALNFLLAVLFLTASVLVYSYWDTIASVFNYVRNLALWK